MAEAVKKISFFKRIAKYFREVRAEIKKVIWPTKKQVINNTAVVIMVIIIVGVIIWLLDMAFTGLLGFVIK